MLGYPFPSVLAGLRARVWTRNPRTPLGPWSGGYLPSWGVLRVYAIWCHISHVCRKKRVWF